jgi:hypothetical protein
MSPAPTVAVLCVPADVAPSPAAAIPTPPPGDSRPLVSLLQPSVSNIGQSVGKDCATTTFAELICGVTDVVGLV